MAIRAVIFDFGGVLAFHPTQEQLDSAAELCGLSTTEFVRVFWAHRIDYHAGMDPLAYWNGVAKLAGRTFDAALVNELRKREIGFWSRYDDRVTGWIEELRAAGIRSSILSNLPHPLAAELRGNGYVKHFDQITFSCELGVTKPKRAIYEYAVNGLSLPPEETLFLDDRPENVEGARAAGLCSELYVSWEKFREIPARYGLPLALRQ